MKTLKLSFDFSDNPKLVELLRIHSAATGKSQKALLTEALNHYFSHVQDDEFITKVAEQSFAEWNNPDDDIYNNL